MSKRKDKQAQSEENDKLTKKEEEIAKYVRFNCPTSTTLFEGNEVHYFSGSKAVDTLWESKYGSKAKNDPFFKTRDDAFHYIADLFSKQLFFRAKKLVAKKKDDKEKEKDKITEGGDAPKSPKKDVEKRKDKKEEETETEVDEKKVEKSSEDSEKKEEAKKKKKVKLLVHSVQVFTDDKDVYVWVFDPTPFYKKVIGVLMLLGTIVGCLFPLWPMWLRQGVYYLSLGGIGVFASIIVVAILRTILFGIIYAVTFGKHKLWVLPNLTEDCGVLESFQPWYTYEYCSGEESDKKKTTAKKEKKKSKKEKNSDNEEEEEEKAEEHPKSDKNEKEDQEDVSTDDNYEKIDGEESDEISSVPPSPADAQVRKRRPAKV
ncbi:unnamed protein product [Caenorhabditis angaria]|uniref:Translocation protein SEC62 n=1 Tax=Caenorhabditis angaria TaxID=860376 RepID=A0A9P1ID83_9PELO|nr:unnamed protein product [Caenorhabditis angaria]